MRKFLNYTLYTSLLMIALTFSSCQTEYEELPGENEQETIMANSSTAQLVEKTVSNDGSFDNIVDGSSCFNIRFPYTVEVNGLELTIDAVKDLEQIEEIFDAFDDDEDILEILFPITITLGDYTEITINGEGDLREWAEKCIEGGDDDDIECIDFVYPVTLFTFDINRQQTGNVTVESDMEMRRFFAGLDEEDLISIEFPVTLKLYDGTEIVVDSNGELANAIESAKEACDEDDDNDYNDDDFDKERLDSYLVKCPWLVREVKRDGINQTDQYFEYLMNFKEDGTVTVKDRMGNNLEGTWNTRASDDGALLKLEFDVLVDFSLEWLVYEIEEGKIKLYAGEGNRIIMQQYCEANTDPDGLREILKECSWIIKKVVVDNEEIRRLLGYEFQFMPEGVVTLTNGDVVSEGTWEITMNAQERLVMAINIGEEPGVSFEWPIADLKDDRLKFEIPEIDYELILQRVCNDNADDGDVPEIRNIMMGGEWMVAQYSEGDMDETDNYAAYTFAFQAEHMIAVTTGDTGPTIPGLWRVIRNSDGKLKVYLNLGDTDPLGELTEDWEFVSISEDGNRIELKDINEEDESITTLVFEKKQ